MNRCRFIGKSKQLMGKYGWEQLQSEWAIPKQKDIRFELFNGDGTAKGFMFDFDNVTYLQGYGLMKAAKAVLGDIEMHHVFTGNGHHIYVPVENGIDKEDCRQGKAHYTELAHQIAEEMGWPESVVDAQVFTTGHYGRVPGSTNSKNGKIVTYVKRSDGDRLEYIDDLITLTPVVETKPVVLTKNKSNFIYRPREYCEFIKYCLENAGELPHPVWLRAMEILGYVDDFETADEISRPHPEYSTSEVESFTNPTAMKYFTKCSRVESDLGELTGNPCQRCSHGGYNGCPSMVTGVLPTPSASRGFHKVSKEGEIVPNMIHAVDVVNHWVNTNKGHAYSAGDSLYKWDKKSWKIVNGINSESRFPKEILTELQQIPRYRVMEHFSSTELKKTFNCNTTIEMAQEEEFDNPRYVNFKNGVYDMDTGQLHDHAPEFKMIEVNTNTYDPEATCPRWEGWLTDILGKEGARLIQVFFGLALSNVPVEEYQQFLWLEGGSGTGKSTVVRILRELLGTKKTACLTTSSINQKEGGFTFDFRGKSALIFDDFKPPNSKTYSNSWESFITHFTTAFEVGVRVLRVDTYYAKPKCTMFFSANGAPPITGEETGVNRRIRLLRFYKRPEVEDGKFADQFVEEMSGIINWALKGLTIYKRCGRIPMGVQEKEEKEFLIEEVHDPFTTFCKEHIEFNFFGKITATRLYNVFCSKMRVDTNVFTIQAFG